MKHYEKKIRDEDLMIEFWWEPKKEAFRAVVRNDGQDDGWAAFGKTAIDAIEGAVAAYEKDTGESS